MFIRVCEVFARLRFGLVFMTVAGCFLSQSISAQDLSVSEAEKVDGLGATTKLDKKNLESQIAAYKAVGCSANEMNAQIRNLQVQGKIRNLLVYDPDFERTLSEYSVLINQLLSLEKQYLVILPPETKAAGGGIAALVNPATVISKLATDTMKFFNTDSVISSNEVYIARDEFIAKAVRGLDVDVYYPYKAIPLVFNDRSDMMEAIKRLAELRFRASVEIAKDANSELSLRLDELNKDHKNILTQLNIITETEPPAALDEIEDEEIPEEYSYIQGYFDPRVPGPGWKFNRERWKRVRNYRRQRNTIDYLRAESAYNLLIDEDTKDNNYWLDVEISVAGGNSRIDRNPMLDIFRGGNKVTFSAGAVVSYRIFRSDGRMLTSDTIMTYMPYQKSAGITEFVCQPTNTKNKIPVP